MSNNTLGTIGTDNYKMKDCPFHLPKENYAFFTKIQNASYNSAVTTYGNSYYNPNKFANKAPVKFT